MVIRKSGWLIFLILSAIVFLLFYVFAGFALRKGFVYGLEKIVGAEVNIQSVSLGLAPISLDIHGLQVTDRDNPELNSLSFDHARAALELWPALLGYYVVNDLKVAGLASGRERAVTGKVYRSTESGIAQSQGPKDLVSLLNVDLPSVDELLARANLQTVEKGRELQQVVESQERQLNEVGSALPDKQKVLDLQAKVNELTGGKIKSPADLAEKTKQLDAIKAELKQEQTQLRTAQEQLQQTRESLKSAVNAVKDAKKSDWQKLQALANIGDGGLASLSQLLLGDMWAQRLAQIESFYHLAKPYIPEASDDDQNDVAVTPINNRILPLINQPYPNLWIKSASVSWLVASGEASIKLKDVTTQHHITARPTQFDIDARQLPQLASLQIHGDYKILAQLAGNVTWKIEGWQLDDFTLGQEKTFLLVDKGLLGSVGSFNILDNRIDQQAQFNLRQAELSGSGNKYVEQLAELLNKQAEIPLRITASGTIGHPEVKVRSPLDAIVGDAIMGDIKKRAAVLRDSLRGQLQQVSEQQLAVQEPIAERIGYQQQDIDQLDNIISESLKTELKSIENDAKDKVKDKLRNLGK